MAPARDAGRAASLNLSDPVEATDAGSGRETVCQREKPRVISRSSQQGQAQRLGHGYAISSCAPSAPGAQQVSCGPTGPR